MKMITIITSVIVACSLAGIGTADERGSADTRIAGKPKAQAAQRHGFVTRQGSKLFLNGKEYRAIGVNLPHLSQGYMGTWHHWSEMYGTQEAMRKAIVEAVDDAAANNIAFFRFFAGPGYPYPDAVLYFNQRNRYWALMDEVVKLCRDRKIKLVPCLNVTGWAQYFPEEVKAAVLDHSSKSYAGMRQYVKEFVTRYKDDPTILMWELENESFLTADVSNGLGEKIDWIKAFYPKVTTFREKYVVKDFFTFDQLVVFYRETVAYIRSLDSNHLISSGDANVRDECSSRREGFPDHFKFRVDTLSEHLANYAASQAPVDVWSLHFGGNFTDRFKTPADDLDKLDYLRAYIRTAKAAAATLYIGELTQDPPRFKQDPEAKWCRAALSVIEEEGVPLTSLWVFGFKWQDKDGLNISSCREHPALMKQIAEFNRKYAQRPETNSRPRPK